MRAIILSAGQGRRLFPLTEKIPKCLLTLQDGTSVLEFQLRVLAACGVRAASVIVGFGAEAVEERIAKGSPRGIEVESLYNPFFESTDNLVTAWLARERMRGDFLLLNGDTIFGPDLLRRVLDSPHAPATMTIDRKTAYDEDDMKVTLDRQGRVRAVAKTLAPDEVHAEAIGMIRFAASGAQAFVEGLERAVRDPETHRRYYLAVVDEVAAQGRRIDTVSVEGLWWQEIDCPDDLRAARAALSETPIASRNWEGPLPAWQSTADAT